MAFALCQRWMKAQTKQPDKWIVVDDGVVPTFPIVAGVDYIRREPKLDDPKCTLALNLKQALRFINGDSVLFFEDDDYYAPQYIWVMDAVLKCNASIVGIERARYYYLPGPSFYRNANNRHASLAQTMISHKGVKTLREIIEHSDKPFIDIELWKAFVGSPEWSLFNDDADPLFVGIKGMPGRRGAGGGHLPNLYRDRIDHGFETLRKWMPIDHKTYEDLRRSLWDNE